MLKDKSRPINKEYLNFSDKEIYCCLKKNYQDLRPVELNSWINASSYFIFKYKEISFPKMLVFLYRLKAVINYYFINNSLISDEMKKFYLQVFIENIKYITSFKMLEYFTSIGVYDVKLSFIHCVVSKQRELLLGINRDLKCFDLARIDSINFLKLFHNFRANGYFDLLLSQLLWMYFFISRWLSHNPTRLLDMKFHISVTTSKVLDYSGYSDTSEALARKSLVDFAELLHLRNQENYFAPNTSASIFHVAAVELSCLVFKRSVFESRKRPQGYLRPKVKVEFATLLQHSWPRTITERYLNQLTSNSSAQILAILESLSLRPGARRSLITPKPAVDSSDWEMSDVYTELFIAALELIYPNSSKRLIPNFLSGIHVVRKIPPDENKNSDGVINHTIALNELKFLRWTQLDLVYYQYHYHDITGDFEINQDLSSESSTTVTNASCTIDSLMKLIQIYFACGQYDIFDLISRETLHVFKDKLTNLIKQQSPKECVLYVQAQIDILELLRALYSAHSLKKVLSKNETLEDVQEISATTLCKSSIKQHNTTILPIDITDSDKEVNSTRLMQRGTSILGFLPKGIIKLVQKLDSFIRKKDELQISMYDAGTFVDTIVVLWDYCHTICQKLFIQSKLNTEYFSTIEMKLIGLLYLLNLIKSVLELFIIEVADGFMSCNLTIYVMWIIEIFEQKLFFHHDSKKESTQILHLSSTTIKFLLDALTLQLKSDDVYEPHENEKSTLCMIDLWTGIWNKVMDMINWSRNIISKRMTFLQINQPQNSEIKSLSELQVELLWFEHTVRWKLRNLECLTWRDSNEVPKEKLDKKIEQMDENSLKQCGRNTISKAFYYCLRAEYEINDETAMKYFQIAEKLLLSKWPCEFDSIGGADITTYQHSSDLHKKIPENEIRQCDRPPPPTVIAKCETSMILKTQKWNPSSGEQVHFYALYGKQTFVSNQKVHITDNKLPNSGIMVVCNNGFSVLNATNLVPNEEYVFAVVAYDEKGQPLGSYKHGLGQSTKPILACSSLCLYTALCHLIESTFRRKLFQCLKIQSINIIWEYLTQKCDTNDNDKPTRLTGLELKSANTFKCSNVLLKHLTTCILWHCSFYHTTENLSLNNFANSTYLLDKQIQKLHLCEKLIIGLELSAKLNDVQLLLDFANLIYETLSFNIEMSSVNSDYAKILLRSLTIILGVRKFSTKLTFLNESMSQKLTHLMIKFTFGLTQVFEAMNELKGVTVTLKIVKAALNQLIKDMKPCPNQSVKKRISQGKVNSSYFTGRIKTIQYTDHIEEVNSAIKTIDAYNYLVTAKINPPRGELFGSEDQYQAIACIATKPIKAAIKDVMKFNRRTIFLQLVNIILERVQTNQITLIQPHLHEIRGWLNRRDQLLIKSCQSFETTDIMKMNDNMNATSLDKTKTAGFSTEMNHLCSLLSDYYSRKVRHMKLRNLCQEEWIQRSQFNLLQAQIEQNDLWEKWQPIIAQTEALEKMKQVEWFTYYSDHIIIDYDKSLTESLLNKSNKMTLRKSITNRDEKKVDKLIFNIPHRSTNAVYKTFQAINDYLGPINQERLCVTNNSDKRDKNQCPIMENGYESNEDSIDTNLVLTLKNDIRKMFVFIKRSTNLGYRAECWSRVYDAAKFCWNVTAMLSFLLSRLSIWCNRANIHKENDGKMEAKIKVSNKSPRKGLSTEIDKGTIQARVCNISVLEIIDYLQQCTNRRALAEIAWSCWLMSADNILDLLSKIGYTDSDENTVAEFEYGTDLFNKQFVMFWRPEIINKQLNVDWNWLHCFMLKALEIICRASKWESLIYLGMKTVGIFGEHWAPCILPFVIFGQNQIMKRLNEQKITKTTADDISNLKPWEVDFRNPVSRSQMQLYSALYHYNAIQPKSDEAFRSNKNDIPNELGENTLVISLTSKQFLEFTNQIRTFKRVTHPWTQSTKVHASEKSNFNWIDFKEQESERKTSVQPKICMNEWLIPQSYLKEELSNSKSKSISETELSLYNIFVPLNSIILENELEEAERLHYSGIMNKLDQARLYQSLVRYQLLSFSQDETNQKKISDSCNCKFVLDLIELSDSVYQWSRNLLFATNLGQGLGRKDYENLIDHTIKLYNEALELITAYNNSLHEMMVRFELLRFHLEVDQIKRATHQASLIVDILFGQKSMLDNFDHLLNNHDVDNIMRRYSFKIIQKFGVSGCLLGALVMGLLSKDRLVSERQQYQRQMICAALFKLILHCSLPCAISDFDYYNNSVPTDSLKILKLDQIVANYCFDLNIIVNILQSTLDHLVTNEHYAEAFPIVYLFHYVGKELLKSTELEVKSKLFQIKCLIGTGALKQALLELCTVLQEQSNNNSTRDRHIALIDFNDSKMQDSLNTLLTCKVSKQTIYRWKFLLFCEIQLVRAEICYEIAKSIPCLPKKTSIENINPSPNHSKNQVTKTSGRKTKNQEINIIRLIYEMDNQTSINQSNFQAYLKELLYICGSDICQIIINNIHNESSFYLDCPSITIFVEAGILLAKLLTSQHQARSGSILMAYVLKYLQKLLTTMGSFEKCKSTNLSINLDQKSLTQQDFLNLWFRCRVEVARCQLCEVDCRRLFKELPVTENYETPNENINLKSALDECKFMKSKKYLDEFSLLSNQLGFLRNKICDERVTNIMIEEIKFVKKCSQLHTNEILRESDTIVQEIFQNILTVNDDSVFMKMEERLNVLQSLQTVFINELNNCGEDIRNVSLFQHTVSEIKLPLHKNWKNLIQTGLRISLILLSLGDIISIHSIIPQTNYLKDNHQGCIRVLTLLDLKFGEIYEKALSVLSFCQYILSQLPPNSPCVESELMFVKGHLEMRLFLESKISWQSPSQSWLRSICISAYVTGDKLFQHRTEIMLAYFWQLVYIQSKCQHLVIKDEQHTTGDKSKILSSKKQLGDTKPSEVLKVDNLVGKFTQSAGICIWNILFMIDQFLSEGRQSSSSLSFKNTEVRHQFGQSNRNKSITSKLTKVELYRSQNSTNNSIYELEWSLMHQFDLVAQKCLDYTQILSPDSSEYELMNLSKHSTLFDEPFDYMKNQNYVSQYWNSVFNHHSIDFNERQLTSQKQELKKTDKIQLTMDTLKLYQSVLYENLLNTKQLCKRNEQNISDCCPNNSEENHKENEITNSLMRKLIISISPVPYYSQEAEYWSQRFTSLQNHLHELNGSVETEISNNLRKVINTTHVWFDQQLPENENLIQSYVSPYTLNFERQSGVSVENETKLKGSRLSKYLLIQTMNNFENDNSLNGCLSVLISCFSSKAKHETYLYQQRLILFDNIENFFKAIEQFNLMVVKYNATYVLSEREKANSNIKGTVSKSSYPKANDPENLNQSNQEFRNEFSSWLNSFDAILRNGKILHHTDKSEQFTYVIPNSAIQTIQPTDETFNSLKEIISWRYFGGSLVKSKLAEYITKLYRLTE
ncbi:Cilia- and flagella-associated protein [Schistosoma japonicum]|nr:Cilia- and flagella-associated protein [Schistosoma japonicum]